MKQLIFLSLILFSFNSCMPVFNKLLLGIDSKLKWESQTEITAKSKKLKIPYKQSFTMDTASYFMHVVQEYNHDIKPFLIKEKISKPDSLIITKLQKDKKDNTQPVQIRFFEKSGKPIFKMVNCYVDSPIKMNWNVQNCFDEFPPKNIKELKNSLNDSLQVMLKHIRTLDNQKIHISQLPKKEYYAIVFWNSWFKKPSRKLIELLHQYNKDYENKTYYLFVNNHNSILWELLDVKNKELVKNQLNNNN